MFEYDDLFSSTSARGDLGRIFSKNDEYLLSYGTSEGSTNRYITIVKINNGSFRPTLEAIGSINFPNGSTTVLPDEDFTAKVVGFTTDYSDILDRIIINSGIDLTIYSTSVNGETLNLIQEKVLRIRRNR